MGNPFLSDGSKGILGELPGTASSLPDTASSFGRRLHNYSAGPGRVSVHRHGGGESWCLQIPVHDDFPSAQTPIARAEVKFMHV